MEDFVRKVKKTRLKKKWTQYRLAKESGLSREMIAKLELGRHSPTLETATKICRSLAIEFVINPTTEIIERRKERKHGEKDVHCR